MFDSAIQLISAAKKIIIIQPENPDGDSLGSALALEDILAGQDKEASLYCQVEVPKYMRYIRGWDRIANDFNYKADLAIIVDTAADLLLEKTLQDPAIRNFLETKPVLVIDHHDIESSLSFNHTLLKEEAVATSEIIYQLATHAKWDISAEAAENMLVSILSDSLGLTTPNVTPQSFSIAGELVNLGAKPSVIESRRREYMKKSPEILKYKGELIDRIEYMLDGKLALVHIPWEDIQAYSDQYNPSVLVLDEMRLVTGVEVAVAIKTYPDGKLTGKLRTNMPIAGQIAGFFGGGGHEYSAGFKIYEQYEKMIPELIEAAGKAIEERENAESNIL